MHRGDARRPSTVLIRGLHPPEMRSVRRAGRASGALRVLDPRAGSTPDRVVLCLRPPALGAAEWWANCLHVADRVRLGDFVTEVLHEHDPAPSVPYPLVSPVGLLTAWLPRIGPERITVVCSAGARAGHFRTLVARAVGVRAETLPSTPWQPTRLSAAQLAMMRHVADRIRGQQTRQAIRAVMRANRIGRARWAIGSSRAPRPWAAQVDVDAARRSNEIGRRWQRAIAGSGCPVLGDPNELSTLASGATTTPAIPVEVGADASLPISEAAEVMLALYLAGRAQPAPRHDVPPAPSAPWRISASLRRIGRHLRARETGR